MEILSSTFSFCKQVSLIATNPHNRISRKPWSLWMIFVKALSPKEPRASWDDSLWWWNVPSFGMNLACALTQGTAHLYQKHNALWIPPHFAMLCVVVSLASLWLHNDHNGSYIGVTVVHSPLDWGPSHHNWPNARWPRGSSVNSCCTVHQHI